MSWRRTPDGSGYYCVECGYATDGDPADIARHRLEHLAKLLQEAPTPVRYGAGVIFPLTPDAAIDQAGAILRDDLPRARKLWYPTR